MLASEWETRISDSRYCRCAMHSPRRSAVEKAGIQTAVLTLDEDSARVPWNGKTISRAPPSALGRHQDALKRLMTAPSRVLPTVTWESRHASPHPLSPRSPR